MSRNKREGTYIGEFKPWLSGAKRRHMRAGKLQQFYHRKRRGLAQ